jgi:hypothetical protein
VANTFIKIQTVTVGVGGAASIEFTSIPQTYTDLKLVTSLRDAVAGVRPEIRITFNSSSTGYSGRIVRAFDNTNVGSTTSSTSYFDAWRVPGSLNTASLFSNDEIYIPNYTSANNKSFGSDNISESALPTGTTNYLSLSAGRWANSAAITSIKFVTDSGSNIVQYSSATLYGIKNT